MTNFRMFVVSYLYLAIFIIPFGAICYLPSASFQAGLATEKTLVYVIAGLLITCGLYLDWLSARMLGRALLHASAEKPRDGLVDDYYTAICSIGRVWKSGMIALAWGVILMTRILTL